MATPQMVKQALKDRNPALFRSLEKAGELHKFAVDLSDEINGTIVDKVQDARLKGKWDKLGPMECVRLMNAEKLMVSEAVHAEMLEFPQDETSPPSGD